MVEFYGMMYKRKSFRRFTSDEKISKDELAKIAYFTEVLAERIADDVPMAYKIVPRSETSCKRGEYCILIYSNFDNLSLLNMGYTFAQLDFFLASINIGSCWYGMGKANNDAVPSALPYTIMISIGKANIGEFRKDYTKAKRKPTDEIYTGDLNSSLMEYVKYSPSACNSQPWILSNNQEKLSIHLNSKEKMIIPKDKIVFYNTIDLGIMIFSCEIWLRKNGVSYKRKLNCEAESFKSGDIIADFIYEN